MSLPKVVVHEAIIELEFDSKASALKFNTYSQKSCYEALLALIAKYLREYCSEHDVVIDNIELSLPDIYMGRPTHLEAYPSIISQTNSNTQSLPKQLIDQTGIAMARYLTERSHTRLNTPHKDYLLGKHKGLQHLASQSSDLLPNIQDIDLHRASANKRETSAAFYQHLLKKLCSPHDPLVTEAVFLQIIRYCPTVLLDLLRAPISYLHLQRLLHRISDYSAQQICHTIAASHAATVDQQALDFCQAQVAGSRINAWHALIQFLLHVEQDHEHNVSALNYLKQCNLDQNLPTQTVQYDADAKPLANKKPLSFLLAMQDLRQFIAEYRESRHSILLVQYHKRYAQKLSKTEYQRLLTAHLLWFTEALDVDEKHYLSIAQTQGWQKSLRALSALFSECFALHKAYSVAHQASEQADIDIIIEQQCRQLLAEFRSRFANQSQASELLAKQPWSVFSTRLLLIMRGVLKFKALRFYVKQQQINFAALTDTHLDTYLRYARESFSVPIHASHSKKNQQPVSVFDVADNKNIAWQYARQKLSHKRFSTQFASLSAERRLRLLQELLDLPKQGHEVLNLRIDALHVILQHFPSKDLGASKVYTQLLRLGLLRSGLCSNAKQLAWIEWHTLATQCVLQQLRCQPHWLMQHFITQLKIISPSAYASWLSNSHRMVAALMHLEPILAQHLFGKLAKHTEVSLDDGTSDESQAKNVNPCQQLVSSSLRIVEQHAQAQTISVETAKQSSSVRHQTVSEHTEKSRSKDFYSAQVTLPDKQNLLADLAGVVILHPYIVPLLSALGYLRDNQFCSQQDKYYARQMLVYLATGQVEVDTLNLSFINLLCDIDEATQAFNIDVQMPTEKQINTINSLLIDVRKHWNLRGTSIDGLRETFLIRSGYLKQYDDVWQISVLPETVDILLKRLPWQIATFKLPWFKQPMQVNWSAGEV